MTKPLFPGGVAVSDLRVYDWDAEDGCRGGSPHLHTASSEGYVVTGGTGEVHTVTPLGTEVHRLVPGEVVWFSPGTVHRLVNHGDLALIVVMQNAGLPEAGDAMLIFPNEVLDDPEAYTAAATLPADADADPVAREAAARTRRDLATRGYLELLDDIDERGAQAAMADLHRRAAALVQPKVAAWQRLWAATVEAETRRTQDQLAALGKGEVGMLTDAAVVRGIRSDGPRAYGMCGRLQTWKWPEPPTD